MANVKRRKTDCKTQQLGATVVSADSRGRVTLGLKFANRRLVIQRVSDTELIIRQSRVIPEDEAWLYKNPAALKSVYTGLAQARSRNFATAPPRL